MAIWIHETQWIVIDIRILVQRSWLSEIGIRKSLFLLISTAENIKLVRAPLKLIRVREPSLCG
jgi:hypothetical protein